MEQPEQSAGPGDASAPPAPEAARDDAAWAVVVARWEEEAAHRAYLDAFPDLEGLALAGRRYRAVLEARPGDPVAARWRDEVLKRATAQAFLAAPAGDTVAAARWVHRAGWLVAGGLLAASLWLAARVVLSWRSP